MSTIFDAIRARGELVGEHQCGSCPKVHYRPYETWCRAERQRLHPSNFERWSEAQHKAKRRALTWDQQQTVWAHTEAWEKCFDGEWTVEETRAQIARLDRLPRVISPQKLARRMVIPAAKPEPPPPDFEVVPVTPERLAEVQAQLGEDPDATAGHMKALEGAAKA